MRLPERCFSVLFLFVFGAVCFADAKKDEPKPAQSIQELQQQLEKMTFSLASSDVLTRFGKMTVWSVMLFLTTIAFAGSSILAAYAAIIRPAESVRRGVRWFSAIVSVALLIAVAYFVYWGIIGLRTWA